MRVPEICPVAQGYLVRLLESPCLAVVHDERMIGRLCGLGVLFEHEEQVQPIAILRQAAANCQFDQGAHETPVVRKSELGVQIGERRDSRWDCDLYWNVYGCEADR